MFQGKMTYLGIAKLALAYVLQGYATQEEVDAVVEGAAQAVSAALAVMGIVEAVYGRYRIARAKYE
jgi:hypothetical protein